MDNEWHIFWNDTDPASMYGGSWVELAQGTFIMAAGDIKQGYKATLTVDTHGNPNGMHTMTLDELVRHDHKEMANVLDKEGATGAGYVIKMEFGKDTNSQEETYQTYTAKTGNGKAFDIRPPTISAHIWRRTS